MFVCAFCIVVCLLFACVSCLVWNLVLLIACSCLVLHIAMMAFVLVLMLLLLWVFCIDCCACVRIDGWVWVVML